MSKFSKTPKFSPFIATLLSLVCRRWCLVILSNFILWSDVIVFPSRTRMTNSGSAFKWAVTCAICSYPTLMSISITNFSGSPIPTMHLTNFININRQRIRELKAYLRTIRDFMALQCPMPNLGVLEVGCSRDWESPPDVGLPLLFPCNYPISNTFPSNTLQWSHHRHLQISSHSS